MPIYNPVSEYKPWYMKVKIIESFQNWQSCGITVNTKGNMTNNNMVMFSSKSIILEENKKITTSGCIKIAPKGKGTVRS